MGTDATRQSHWDNLCAEMTAKAIRERDAFLATPQGRAKKAQDHRFANQCYQTRLANKAKREAGG